MEQLIFVGFSNVNSSTEQPQLVTSLHRNPFKFHFDDDDDDGYNFTEKIFYLGL